MKQGSDTPERTSGATFITLSPLRPPLPPPPWRRNAPSGRCQSVSLLGTCTLTASYAGYHNFMRRSASVVAGYDAVVANPRPRTAVLLTLRNLEYDLPGSDLLGNPRNKRS